MRILEGHHLTSLKTIAHCVCLDAQKTRARFKGVMSIEVAEEYPDKIKFYDHVPNSGIVHMPGRRFPAVAIQGDSLSIVLSTAIELMAKGKEYQDEDLYYASLELAEKMQSHLIRYENVLEKEGFKKPYSLTAKELKIVDDFENS